MINTVDALAAHVIGHHLVNAQTCQSYLITSVETMTKEKTIFNVREQHTDSKIEVSEDNAIFYSIY